ncbi:MAG: hypothetical protein LBC46_04730 [Treponema sp.]|jgi:hypothetical protein|nr:hypothetical protein [Treponema sp.]
MNKKNQLATAACLAAAALSLSGCGVKASSALSGVNSAAKTSAVPLYSSGPETAPAPPSANSEVKASAVSLSSSGQETAPAPSVFTLGYNNNSRVFSAGATKGGSNIVEIKEKMFIAQVNDVYLNPDDYVGKTIKLEGLFMTQDNGAQIPPYYFVIRYGPGCCGNDGNAGFEVIWDNQEPVYPRDNEWVEAVGVFGSYEEDGYPYYCLSLASLKVLDERGQEFVLQ